MFPLFLFAAPTSLCRTLPLFYFNFCRVDSKVSRGAAESRESALASISDAREDLNRDAEASMSSSDSGYRARLPRTPGPSPPSSPRFPARLLPWQGAPVERAKGGRFRSGGAGGGRIRTLAPRLWR